MCAKKTFFKINLRNFTKNAYSFYLNRQGEVRIEDIYRRLLLASAHLHLLIHGSERYQLDCPKENELMHRKILQ